MEVVFGIIFSFAVSFFIAMVFDWDEGGFLMMFIVTGIMVGVFRSCTITEIKKTSTESVAQEQVTQEQVAETTQPISTPAPVPVVSTPTLTIDTNSVASTSCETVGDINFMCTNSVKLGDKWYTVKINCDRDPYDGTLECKIK